MHSYLESQDGPMTLLETPLKWHWTNTGNNGTNTYLFQSQFRTPPKTPALLVSQANFFMTGFLQNVLNLRPGLKIIPIIVPNAHFADELFRGTKIL